MPPQKIDLAAMLASFEETWVPKIAAELNGQNVKVAKFLGPYVWHQHEGEDEMFLVVTGSLRIEFEDGAVEVGPGEMCVVPRGVRHRPVAEELVECVLFEPVTTRNTGDVDHAYTIEPEDLGRVS